MFSTGQALAFEEVMRRVRPKEEIQRIRDTIAIKQFEQLSGTKIAVSVELSVFTAFFSSKVNAFLFVLC